jgi:hypothetical protein
MGFLAYPRTGSAGKNDGLHVRLVDKFASACKNRTRKYRQGTVRKIPVLRLALSMARIMRSSQ